MIGEAAVPNERQTQRAILRMMAFCFRDVLVHHSPNGAHFAGNDRQRSIHGGKLLGDGMKPGFPDLVCMWGPSKVAFMEMKRPGGRAELHQLDMHDRLRALGFPVAVVRSQEDAYRFMIECGAPQSAELVGAAA